MGPRGIKDRAGNPYNPSYYKRGLQTAIDKGGLAVADYIRRYLQKPPSEGYRKLEDANSLDLACEALMADPDKPYAHLFTNAERAAARKRLDWHLEAIERRKSERRRRIDTRRSELPKDLAQLRSLAAQTTTPEEAIAVNSAIISQVENDLAALNRLGRAFEAIGQIDDATQIFHEVLAINPDNPIASRRLRDLNRVHRDIGRQLGQRTSHRRLEYRSRSRSGRGRLSSKAAEAC
jgi:tetratricopeptide (TPR) repeat protein